MARALQAASLTFGLVSIPVKIYPAATSQSVSFHLLHQKDGSRVHQQLVCNAEEKVVPRTEIVKGFEVSKGRYVEITAEELKALEAEANRNVDILEFVPLDAIDPVYVEKSYYLVPDRGADKPYRLLASAMQDTQRAAVAQLVLRGKEQVVMIRPSTGGRLILSSLYYADEVRAITEIELPSTKLSERERPLAEHLLDQLTTEKWHPQKYRDTYRQRVRDLIHRKEKGEAVVAPPDRKPAEVVTLMSALERSLAQTRRKPTAKGTRRKRRAA